VTSATLSGLLGETVASDSWRGTLDDLGVALGPGSPRVTSARVRRDRTTERTTEPFVLAGLGVVTPAAAPEGRELLLRRDVLDRQVFDGVGARLSRVGDVHLGLEDGVLAVTAVETGFAAVLRRLGAPRLAARLRPRVVIWDDLHLVSGPGHALQLDSSDAAVHRLEPRVLAELVRRVPGRSAGDLLERLHPSRREQVASALRRAAPRRRSSDPLSVRKRAPS
jgi:hypothetical protein